MPKQEKVLFSGQLEKNKDGSASLFICIKDTTGEINKNLFLTKDEINGLKKMADFFDFG